jgi:putative ABC transport system permease protein
MNHLKISLRYLLKNRTFSFVNLFGLTLGFLCFILIALFVQDELSFDMFHADADKIVRVIQHETKDGKTRSIAPVAARIAPASAKEIPEVEDAIRVSAFGRITVGNDPATRDFQRINVADPNFFSFFDFKLLEGDPKTALATPNGLVLSQKLAKKYFGNESAVGKQLWTSTQEFTITGVMEDPPKNSHMQLDLVFAEITWERYFDWYKDFVASDWKSNSYITYLKLKPGADPSIVAEKVTRLVERNYPAGEKLLSNFELQPLADVHLFSDQLQGAESGQTGTNGIKPFYLYMFGGVALLILSIACLNYMNLSTAAAFKRTREIGTRKTLGARKGQLIGQFAGEALILATISLITAIALIQLVLPFVNSFVEKDLALAQMPLSWTVAMIAALLGAGVLSCIYPAFIVSKVVPTEAMKREVKLGKRTVPVRKMLVVAQFAISIIMIASTLVIYRQLEYMKSKDLGFELSNLVVIDINSAPLRNNFENVKDRFRSVSGVKEISTSTRVPGEWKSFPIANIRHAESTEATETIFVGIDNDFLSTYNIKLLEGRNFAAGKSDSTKVILTKLAVEELGLQNPVGQVIEIPDIRWGGSVEAMDVPFRVEVIGVCDNFHFESFKQEMRPLIFGYANTPVQRIDYYTMRLETKNLSETIQQLKAVNNSLTPDDPLEYTFLDERFETFYRADLKRGQIFIVFSVIIVLIACMGLFALVSYSIESRTKEIGIRKVLGASVQNIVKMISTEFLVLILVAGFIAIPVTWYLMRNWLQEFAYHIPMSADIFILAAIIALVIAFATISIKAINAAIVNPVKSLRSE